MPSSLIDDKDNFVKLTMARVVLFKDGKEDALMFDRFQRQPPIGMIK